MASAAIESEPLLRNLSGLRRASDSSNRYGPVTASLAEEAPGSTIATLLRRATTFFQSASPLSLYHRTKRVVAHGFQVHLLLVLLPFGIVGGVLQWNPVLVFVFNFLAIIPLSALVSDSSDSLSNALGDLWGALINATCGNCVEVTVGIIALLHREFRVAQAMMIGSILSDILLVLGGCLISASWGRHIGRPNAAMADALSAMMLVMTVTLILPTALYATFTSPGSPEISDKILSFSRGTALLLLFLYLVFLYFQLGTHRDFFLQVASDPDSALQGPQRDDAITAPASDTGVSRAALVLILSSVGTVACTHYLIGSMDQTAEVTHISKTFIATVLFPVDSNCAEMAAVIATSRSGEIDFAIGVIVSSILQIGLLVTPFLVVLGWILQQPMTLKFDTFHTASLFFAVLVVSYVLQDGKYTYIHGTMLVALYIIMASAFLER